MPVTLEPNGDRLQVNGNDVALHNELLGVNQTWQNVTADREIGVEYTNDTNRPIALSVLCVTESEGQNVGILVGVVSVAYAYSRSISPYYADSMFVIVPPGSTYKVNAATGSTIHTWAELR